MGLAFLPRNTTPETPFSPALTAFAALSTSLHDFGAPPRCFFSKSDR